MLESSSSGVVLFASALHCVFRRATVRIFLLVCASVVSSSLFARLATLLCVFCSAGPLGSTRSAPLLCCSASLHCPPPCPPQLQSPPPPSLLQRQRVLC